PRLQSPVTSLQSAVPALALSVFTVAAGAGQRIRGGEKIQWDQIIASIATEAGPAGGAIYSFEGFTSLPLTFYARSSGGRLAVRGVRQLGDVRESGWVVYREGSCAPGVVPARALALRGLAAGPVRHERTLSQDIVTFRVVR